jgi:ABC-2 type transport system ATP-binding protein
MKVGEQLRFFGEMKNMSGRDADAAATRWLERMKLSDWRMKKTDELSKGMQQKVQFIATVMHEPELVVLDEPFSGFDPVNAQLLKEIVLELKNANRAIIFSTHMMEQAEQMCDDICLINRSRKVLEGSIREVKSRFGVGAVALRATGENVERVLSDTTLVAEVKHASDHLEVRLAQGTDAQELLRRLLANGAQVTRFELVEPSLQEIFISQVGEAEAEREAAR